ncbi:putative protein-serine/threonine kinase CMGC-RCK family [Helianthus annuus]|nr:putative protein-serine/threonine kinase CMGC-RCK family [Helianthus annuus]KAJ0467848.1 putative protein-serine/threonine kinase CMGC-RCK family [Helianthus annuus]
MEKYERIMEIGRGAYGVVWKAMNKQTGELVAIKKLIQEYHTAEECMNLREVKSLIKMANHPNIVKLKEIIRQNNTLFLIFECMECDLYKFTVARMKPLRLHHKGYFHRDLKPDNLLVSKNLVKISDLGMAREMNAGAIMAELFTNQPLFQGFSESDVMYKICRVLGTPTESTWFSGLDLARNICYRFPDFPGVRFSELLPTASSDAVNLIASLLSWCPCERPTAMQALQHPFFHGCYRVPPTNC